MTLSAGTKLGRYEIRSQIGAGGMGEVYLARDPKIGRDVAIKVLPLTLSEDKERLARFEQEAQAAGALNHPNILAIYDVETDGGAPYVVSELLEGETLRDMIGGTPLPLRKSLGLGLQVAHGLAAAHEKGIIHRDLKPENLFVTSDGRVKILDFGLAKLIETNGGNVSTDLPTRKVNTDAGAVMGTVGYMSPEQLRGKPVDQRTDIFSFGSVLYEMLSGQKAFQKDSTADTISAILREEPPDLSETNKSVNPGLERIVRRCLEKNREERFHSASDLAFALESLSGINSTTELSHLGLSAAPGQVQVSKIRPYLGWIVAAISLIALVIFASLYFRRADPQSETMRFAVQASEKTTFGDSMAISPDGKKLAYVALSANGDPALWLRPLDSLDAQKLGGTEGAAFPFWSPDSRFIGFFATNKLKKIDANGGPVQTLAEASADPRGGSWGQDGTIIFGPTVTSPLFRISANGGTPVPVTQLDPERLEASHRWPVFLPDGKHFLYYARGGNKELEGVFVASLESSERKFLFASRLQALYAPSGNASVGYLLFVRDGTLLAQHFDTQKLELSGEPVTIAQNVRAFPTEVGPTASSFVSVSNNGLLAYRTGGLAVTRLSWSDRMGKEAEPIVPAAIYHEPMISPNGKKIAVSRQDDNNQDVWLLENARNIMTRLTFDPGVDGSPIWTPDSSQIIFTSARGGNFAIYRKAASGLGPEELLFAGSGNAFPDAVSPDGKQLLFEMDGGAKTKFDIWMLPLSDSGKPVPFLQTDFSETHAQFSPDGRWVTYTSDESGRAEVYVQSFPASGGKWQVSVSGGDQALWNFNGKEIFYLGLDRRLFSVPFTAANGFEAGQATPLFTTRLPLTGLTDERNNYLVSVDGKNFLVNNLVDEASNTPITLVLDWDSGLKK